MARWRPTRRQVLTHGATAAGALTLGSAATLAVSDWAAEGRSLPDPAGRPARRRQPDQPDRGPRRPLRVPGP
ncbi:twin-arginine translocation signal domain-containing protein [Catellatospora coxensis]